MKERITKAGERLKEYLSSDVISFALLRKIVLPIFWEQLFLAGLSLFSIWLLSFDGEGAMSVVNMMWVVNKVFASLCLGAVTGGAVLVAQNIGAKRVEAACRCMVQSMGFVVALTSVLGGMLLLARRPLVGYLLYGAGEEIISSAALYFAGFCVSFPFYALYQSFAGSMRGWGRGGLAWRLTLSVNCAELALTAVFLLAMKMGVSGVTLAMAISRVFGAGHAAALMTKSRRELNIKLMPYLRPDPAILKGMMIIAIPLALEQFFFNSGKAMSQRFIASCGAAHMAANGVVNAAFDLFNLPQITLREALVPVVGMCLGSGRQELAKRYVYRFMRTIRRLLVWLAPLTIAASAALVYSYRLSPQSARLTIWCLALIYISGPPLLAGSLTIPAGLRAGGDAAFVSAAALGSMWCVRVAASWLLAGALDLGVFGLNLAMVLDWLVRGILYRARLKGEAWHGHRLIAEEPA